ncbi:hypothetical protein [Mycolicibacterium wolinskyi]|uniref:hypothetical protein n=1 Tax=Mycolicibacterium wolinskyi TaxID=59750 RepID=UPI00391783ED
MSVDWFERLTGFRELGYHATRERLTVEGSTLISLVNEKRYGIGELTLPSLAELRRRAPVATRRRSTVRPLIGDARALHAAPEFRGATIQVASQFNALEMTSPHMTPDDGVTRYEHDHTQGPACAMAAGAATIFRNYFADVDGQAGQTRDRQLDTLAGLGAAFSTRLGRPVADLWEMRNGYALCTPQGLGAVADLLTDYSDTERDELRGMLAIGLHRDVEVTDVSDGNQIVSQAFCSALPVAYGVPSPDWEPFARLVLEATYEATLLAAAEQAAAGGSNVVLLTRVGGGVFGNHDAWIDDAIARALRIVEHRGLDVRLVSRSAVHGSFARIAREW